MLGLHSWICNDWVSHEIGYEFNSTERVGSVRNASQVAACTGSCDLQVCASEPIREDQKRAECDCLYCRDRRMLGEASQK